MRWYTYNASLLRVLEGLDLELSIKAKNSNYKPYDCKYCDSE